MASKEDSQQSAYQAWVLTLPKRLDALKGITNPDLAMPLKVALLGDVISWRGFQHSPDYKAAIERIREALGISPERWPYVRKLRAVEDMRDALRHRPLAPVVRMAEENVYPGTGWFGRYLNLHGRMEVPLAWHFWAAVALFGLACRRNFVLSRGSYRVWPNHYVVLVGPTTERKTTAVDQAVNLFYRYQLQLEERAASLSPPRNLDIALHYGRGTPQPWFEDFKITDKWDEDPRTGLSYQSGRQESVGFIVNDEVVNLIGKNEAGSETWIRVLTGLYTPRVKWSDSTMKRGKNEFRNTMVSCLFASTASWLRESCTPASFEGGWMGRCVYVPRQTSRRVYAWPPAIDPVEAEMLAHELVDLTLTDPEEIVVSDEIREWFTDWYEGHKEATPKDTNLIGWAGRKPDHLWKLAMVLALSHGRRTLTVADMVGARNILDAEELLLPECFAELTITAGAQLHDFVFAKIFEAGSGGIKRSELYVAVRGRGLKAKELEEIVALLIHEGRVVKKTYETKGANGVRYTAVPPEMLNPGAKPDLG